jgi:hypothetical protein
MPIPASALPYLFSAGSSLLNFQAENKAQRRRNRLTDLFSRQQTQRADRASQADFAALEQNVRAVNPAANAAREQAIAGQSATNIAQLLEAQRAKTAAPPVTSGNVAPAYLAQLAQRSADVMQQSLDHGRARAKLQALGTGQAQQGALSAQYGQQQADVRNRYARESDSAQRQYQGQHDLIAPNALTQGAGDILGLASMYMLRNKAKAPQVTKTGAGATTSPYVYGSGFPRLK